MGGDGSGEAEAPHAEGGGPEGAQGARGAQEAPERARETEGAS